jgi:hypothetical protein
MAKGSKGFGGYEEAMEMRDIIDAMVRQSLDSNRPAPTYARVYTIDAVARTCMVVINGDTVAVKATCGSIIPSEVDQIVRLEGPPGARYIADVLGNNSVKAELDALRVESVGSIAWIQATLASGFSHASGNPVRYRKILDYGSEKIQLRGVCSSSSTTSAAITAFTLPLGYRRSAYTSLIISRDVAGGSNTAVAGINTNGTVVLDGKTTGVRGPQTTVGGSGAALVQTSQPVNPPNNTGYAATSAVSRDSAGSNAHIHNFDHTHSVTGLAHQHGLDAVLAPTSISFDGVEFFL